MHGIPAGFLRPRQSEANDADSLQERQKQPAAEDMPHPDRRVPHLRADDGLVLSCI